MRLPRRFKIKDLQLPLWKRIVNKVFPGRFPTMHFVEIPPENPEYADASFEEVIIWSGDEQILCRNYNEK